MAPMRRTSRSISLPRAARVVPSGQAGAGAATAPPRPHSRAPPTAAPPAPRPPEAVVPAGGGQGPGLGLERPGRGRSGRFLAALLVFGGLERRKGRPQLPAPVRFGAGLRRQGGGVLLDGGRFRLGF